jgi:hypothetical protein
VRHCSADSARVAGFGERSELSGPSSLSAPAVPNTARWPAHVFASVTRVEPMANRNAEIRSGYVVPPSIDGSAEPAGHEGNRRLDEIVIGDIGLEHP